MKKALLGITLNGRPLAEVLPRKPRNQTFTNGISRDLRLPEPEPDFTQWVLLKGVQYLRAAKEPFELSGKSLKGALQYDPDTDKIKCHECGEWFKNYGSHHKDSAIPHPSARRYKLRHYLELKTALVGVRIRETITAARKKSITEKGKAAGRVFLRGHKGHLSTQRPSLERRNAMGNCPVQIPTTINALVDKFGRTPTHKEMRAAGISSGVVAYIFGNYRNAFRAAGIQPRVIGRKVNASKPKWHEKDVIPLLISYKKLHGIWPMQRHCGPNKGMSLPSYPTLTRIFGGLPQAIAKAESRM